MYFSLTDEQRALQSTVADAIVVAADGGALFLVDPADPTVTVTPLDTLDRSGRLTRVRLDGAKGQQLPGAVLPEVLDRGAVLATNDLAGIARVAFTRTV